MSKITQKEKKDNNGNGYSSDSFILHVSGASASTSASISKPNPPRDAEEYQVKNKVTKRIFYATRNK